MVQEFHWGRGFWEGGDCRGGRGEDANWVVVS